MNEREFLAHGGGRWYPASAELLQKKVQGYLAKADTCATKPVAIIAPHAGFDYSGYGAACAHHCLKGHNIERVIVLGPSHYAAFHGVSVLNGYSTYKTPLGPIRIDRSCAESLLGIPGFTYRPDAHTPEHSVENQLPFIQQVLPNATILPCTVGFLDAESYRQCGAALRELLDGKTIIAVSSDFTHYGHSFGFLPFKTSIRENLEKLDRGAIEAIEQCNPSKFDSYLEATEATICGRHPIRLMLEIFEGKAHGRLLHYYTSSDDSQTYAHTVCYASMVIERNE